jgi:hypothetical protein
MRHGTDEACVPGHRAMDGHVIGRIAGARLEDGSPHGPRHPGADRVVALFVRRRQEYLPVISTPFDGTTVLLTTALGTPVQRSKGSAMHLVTGATGNIGWPS